METYGLLSSCCSCSAEAEKQVDDGCGALKQASSNSDLVSRL